MNHQQPLSTNDQKTNQCSQSSETGIFLNIHGLSGISVESLSMYTVLNK